MTESIDFLALRHGTDGDGWDGWSDDDFEYCEACHRRKNQRKGHAPDCQNMARNKALAEAHALQAELNEAAVLLRRLIQGVRHDWTLIWPDGLSAHVAAKAWLIARGQLPTPKAT